MSPDNTIRQKWRSYQESLKIFPLVRERWIQEFMNTGIVLPMPHPPELPADLIGLTCGAKTRSGSPCKRRDLHINGRCKLHGGLSTGPKSKQGKKWSAMNGKRPKRKRTPWRLAYR